MAKKEKINQLEEQAEEEITPIYDEDEARMILGI